MQRSYYQHLPLQPLTCDAIHDLLCDHLGQDLSVASLPKTIEERTKGNPFFIEEVSQSLIESGHLAGVRGAYRLTTPVVSLDVPASVQAVLASRSAVVALILRKSWTTRLPACGHTMLWGWRICSTRSPPRARRSGRVPR